MFKFIIRLLNSACNRTSSLIDGDKFHAWTSLTEQPLSCWVDEEVGSAERFVVAARLLLRLGCKLDQSTNVCFIIFLRELELFKAVLVALNLAPMVSNGNEDIFEVLQVQLL